MLRLPRFVPPVGRPIAAARISLADLSRYAGGQTNSGATGSRQHADKSQLGSRPTKVASATRPRRPLPIPKGSALALEAAAETAARLNQWDFMLVIAPLRVPGGTGSPVNPLAIF